MVDGGAQTQCVGGMVRHDLQLVDMFMQAIPC